MNDRYLYRANRTDNGEWVEGYYTYYPDGMDYSEDTKHVILDTSTNPVKLYFVDPSTICQCTGLKDKNGNLIWENDICIINGSGIDDEDGYFALEWENSTARFVFDGDSLCVDFDNIYDYECEVVGDIFDNPELLEVEE